MDKQSCLGRRGFLVAAATSGVGLALDRLAAQEIGSAGGRTPAHPATRAAHGIGASYSEPVTDRAKEPLDGPWRFIRSNTLLGADAVGFDDAHWEEVKVPHSWQTLADSTDYSNCWYRTKFSIPASDGGKRIYLYFEGVGITAQVYLNGVHFSHRVALHGIRF